MWLFPLYLEEATRVCKAQLLGCLEWADLHTQPLLSDLTLSWLQARLPAHVAREPDP